MLNYLRNSIRRKIARRKTKEYPTKIDTFKIKNYGDVQFANWENPLVEHKEIDQNYLEFLKKFLKEGDVAIDIGANIGHMTVPMSIVCGKTGLTIAFDPNPFVFKILKINTELNKHLTNIQPFNCAITDVDDEFFYYSSEASFNNGAISKEKTTKHGKFTLNEKIKGINLENFLKTQFPERLPKLKLIKIDTEGYDKEIIKSISNVIAQYMLVVITECFGKTTPEERFEHFEFRLSNFSRTI